MNKRYYECIVEGEHTYIFILVRNINKNIRVL